jgi:hypothetical protein
VGSLISTKLATHVRDGVSCSGLVSSMPSRSSIGLCFWFRLVDRRFLRCWSKWPNVVATDFGRCLRTSRAVKGGHKVKCLLLMALIHVCVVGQNKLACRCCRAVDFSGAEYVALACSGAFRCVVHNPGGTRDPSSTISSL